MKIHIPPQSIRRWTGPYLGDYYGSLYQTFNIDLDRKEGKVYLSRRLVKVADTLDALDTGTIALGLVTAFLRTNADCTDRWWALNRNGRLFRTDSSANPLPTDTWNSDTWAATPIDAVDMTIFGNDSRVDSGRNQLFVTRDTDIAVLNDTGGVSTTGWNANWWVTTQAQVGLRAGVPHPIEYFPHRKIVLVGDGNLVHTISRTSDTVNEITTYARLTLPLQYRIESIFTTSSKAWILASHLFAGEGAIIEWDGSSETYNDIHGSYAQFPLSGVGFNGVPIVLNSRGAILEYNGNSFSPMIRNGQKVSLPIPEGRNFATDNSFTRHRSMTVGSDGLIYINLKFSASNFRQKAGIMCLNPITGRFYTKYALGQWGDTDFGNQDVSEVGAIYPVNNATRDLLFGGQIYRVYAGTINSAIWSLASDANTTANRGYFVTQYIPTNEIKEFWDVIWIKFKRFITDTNRIIVKARGSRPMVDADGDPIDATITWASTTTFTVTLASADDALAVGDEVEILAGDNAGILAHITVITGAHGALQTITIDETVVSSTAAARARFDRWKKLGTISSTSVYEQMMNIGIDSSFIQFKVEMRGPIRQLEISELIVSSKPSIKIQD